MDSDEERRGTVVANTDLAVEKQAEEKQPDLIQFDDDLDLGKPELQSESGGEDDTTPKENEDQPNF